MRENLNNFLKYQDLLIELIIKDIKLKYKNSILGILWSMLDPLLMMVVLTIVFGAIFKRDIPNFPVYVMIGRIVYSFFTQSTNSAMDSVLVNRQLIKKIYVPKYFFPLARVCSTFVTFIISFIPLILVMLLTGMKLSMSNLMVIFPLIYLFGISLGVGMILCTIRVFFGDIKHLYSVVLMMLMYMTPIFYPAEIILEKFVGILKFNPLFNILNMIRDAMMYNTISPLSSHIESIVWMIIYLTIGFIFFYKKQDKFIFHL